MSAFFDSMQQHELEWRGAPLKLPVFCYDNRTLGAVYTASTKKVRQLLPVPRARPIELFPGRCLVAINCFEYHDTDLGPYNEVVVAFMMTHERLQLPGLTALLQLVRRRTTAYVWQLPVTTAVARDGGLEIYGYPKFLADVRFSSTSERVSCAVSEGDRPIFTLDGPVLPTRPQRPLRFVTYSMKNDVALVANIVLNPLAMCLKPWRRDVRLTLDDGHPIAQDLRALDMGSRPVLYLYSPKNESVLFAARNLLDR